MNFKKIGLALILSTVLFSTSLTTGYSQGLSPILANGYVANNYALKIFYDTETLRRKILVTFEPLEANKNNNYIIVEVDAEEHKKLLNLGLKVKIDTNFTESMNAPPQAKQVNTLAKGINSPAGTEPSIPGYSCYRTVEGTFSSASTIVANYPNLASWVDVGNSWEKENGLGGHDMQVLKITNSAITTTKPALFITSSIHAREYTPAELITRFAEHLVSHYGVDADITWMLDHHEVHMMLHANPDGRKQAETGLSWRKNTNQNYCGTSSNSRGADLNRNFSFEWDCCNGSSTNECSNTFHGAGPASEPETQAIQSYMTALFGDHRGPSQNDAAPLNTSGIYLDVHSYSELILWPWGFTNAAAPNNMVTLGRKFAFSNNYTPQQSIGLYPTDGTTTSFSYGELGIPSYTFELGTAFFQNCNTFENTIVPDNFPSLLYALKAVRAPYLLPQGPEVINLSLDLGETSPVPAGTNVTLAATASDTRYNNSNGTEPSQNINSAEYYIDTPPWISGAVAVSMTATDGTLNNPNEAITAGINTSGLSEGKHTIFVRAKDANNNWGVMSALFLTIDNNAVLPTVIFEDDFETDLGWSSNPANTDTATTGKWERANPQATNSSGPKQLGTTVSGSYDLVTGATAGSSVGVNDIDNGVTSIRSPNISIPTGGPYTLSFSYYMAHTSNSSSADFLKVSIIGNQTSLILEELGEGNDDDGVWQQFSANIDSFAGQTIYLLIEAADASNGSIVEAGIDDLKIEGIVSGGNQSPNIVSPANQTNNEGDIVSLGISASDPDGDSITYSATNLPPNLSINASTGNINGTLSTASAGSYNVTVSASDGSLSASASFTWTVNNINQAPTLTTANDQIDDEADSVSLQLVASDPDNDTLIYSASNLPDGLSINSSNGLISGTLTQNSSGTYSVSATVSDGTLSDSINFTWTVNNVNQAPVITAPANQNNLEGELASFNIVATDPDGDTLSYSATGLPTGITINTVSGVISGTLSSSSAGNYSVTVTASDGNLSDSATFSWIVSEVNVAPVINNPGNQTSNESSSVTLQIVANDTNGDNLTFSVSGLPTGLTINTSTGLITGNLSMSSNGVYSVTATVTDGILSDSTTFTWTVINVNQAPTINTLTNQNNLEGEVASINVSATDPDGDTLSYSVTGLPAGITINAASGVISGTLSAGSAGNYSVTVTASDGGLSDSATFSWVVSEVNVAPVINNPGDQINDEGTSVSLQIVANDANGDNLNFSATGLPTGLMINTSTGLITGNLSLSSDGTYNITVTASDGILTNSTNFTWTVNNTNQAPTLTAPDNQTNDEGDTVSLTATASDPDGDSISFSASGLPAGISINTNTGVISGTLATGSNGNYTVTINASDGDLVDSASFNWVVNTVSVNTNWMETKLVSGVDSSGWTTVSLNHNYTSLVAVCTVNYLNNSIPEVVRMNNVTSNSFDIRLQNPSNSSLIAETVHCIAMEEGAWTLADGRQIEAQKFNSTRTDRRGSWVGQSANYLSSYTTPVVVGQVMSYNDPDWSVFWSRGSTNRNPATASALFVGKQVSEDTDRTRNNETLGFIVMEAGIGSADSVNYEAQRGVDTVRDIARSVSYTYNQSFNGDPLVGIASQTAMDGGNGSWAVLPGNNPLAGGGMTLAVDEDQIRDSERKHTTEQVMMMVFEAQAEMQLTESP